jgi:cytochrome b pre-mRNA-processing protein 3
MPFSPFRRNRARRTIAVLYGAIVAQARLPVFYRNYAAPDTPEGRLDMVILHAILVTRRLEQGSRRLRDMGQGIFAAFCQDMDDNLREMGVGDLAVPKRMKSIGEAFYGRRAAYDAALAATGEDALAAALQRNVLAHDAPPDAARSLALYVREADARLRSQPDTALAEGTVAFPDPAAFLALATAVARSQ